MQIKIKNFLITEIVGLLYGWELSGKYSRHRSRFLKLLSEQLEIIDEQEKALIKENSELDENDNPKTYKDTDGKIKYQFTDEENLMKEISVLRNEEFILEGEQHKTMILTLREALDSYNGKLAEREAVIYEELCMLFKVDEVIDEENANQ